MPSRNRQRSSSPAPTPPSKRPAPQKRSKATLFDAADAPSKKQKSIEENKKLLDRLKGDGSSEDDSSDEADSDDFEDVPTSKRRKTAAGYVNPAKDDDDDDDAEDAMDWEDAIGPTASTSSKTQAAEVEQDIGDVSISMANDGTYIEPLISSGVQKKGPSKRERQARIDSHCLHVQALMWHNTVRNSWLNDKQVHQTLVEGLTEGVKREVTRWRESMGTLTKEELEAKKKAMAAKHKGKHGRKGKEKKGNREWNYDAQHLEQGVPNLSAGDPLLRLLKVLTSYWRKRFTITAPGLRKQGYMPLRRLRDELKDWEKNRDDAEEHGERIESLKQFRKLAEECEGSRDVGAQLFTALLRGLGMDTRMIANLQPVGFGWSKSEEADTKKPKKKKDGKENVVDLDSDEEPMNKKGSKASSKQRSKGKPKAEKPARKSARATKAEVINIDDSDSPLSSAPSEAEAVVNDENDDDDMSVVDVTPATPKIRPNKKYDRDLSFPNYWTEVCSPVTQKFIPVDPIVLSTIANNDDLLQTFEPRGKKAEMARQVMCYTLAFSSDGTAKDVTVRYLKKHQLPGKTKGMRMAAEKLPIYNRKGKVKRYEVYDWFRTVMSAYDRPQKKCTAADDKEEQTDLKPFKPAKAEKEVEKESLQWYKQSAEFVLEQHLRREEAIIPSAEPVKMFTAGKGDKATEHPVYRRADVVACKTVESWHKEGRALKAGQQPMKLVPTRAVTLIRKREMEDVLRETGEKLKQGLYSLDQTDWIIPPPIKDGVIPKNAFGNMDVYVPTMVPKGAVHLPLKGSAKICRRLQIDYAEACTGFEFGKQRAVPVLTGVVVAEEHEILLRDAWREEQAEIKRKEDVKRTGVSLHWWRKMLLGLRVLERMRIEYADSGGKEEEVNPFVARARREKREEAASPADVKIDRADNDDADAGAGGFFPDGYDEEEVPQHRQRNEDEDGHGMADGGGFLVEDAAGDPTDGDGGFLVEEGPGGAAESTSKKHAPITPVSLQSLHKGGEHNSDMDMEELSTKPNAKRRKPTPRSKKPTRPSSDEEDEDEAADDGTSSLSDITSVSGEQDDTTPPSDIDSDEPVEKRKSTQKKKPLSPRVVVSSAKSKKTTPVPKSRSQNGKAKGKRATPLKSQYFVDSDGHCEDDDDDDGEDGSDADELSDVEVVQPRRTTARTRTRR